MPHLSHGLVGAAERKAMEAELAVRTKGADSPEILPAIEEAYAMANGDRTGAVATLDTGVQALQLAAQRAQRLL